MGCTPEIKVKGLSFPASAPLRPPHWDMRWFRSQSGLNGEQLYTVHVCFSQVSEVMHCGMFVIGVDDGKEFYISALSLPQKSGFAYKDNIEDHD